jgi:hypothetical protein
MRMIKTPQEGPLPSLITEVPRTSPVHDWQDLNPGDALLVLAESGLVRHAQVDTVNWDGTIIWLRIDGIGHRTCHLDTDPIALYRS